ncbi:MAG: roadblock/LC7 domain-containing protein [Deltaproteobacteria bacterium]|nr:roadblock/LC7 domain-containing protein [Deltaproteobacteria bacterium]
MMDFGEVIRQMVEGVEGGVAGTIMGRDGIAIQDYVREGMDYDVEAVGVEYGKVIEEIKRVAGTLNLGEVEEISIAGQGFTVTIRFINRDYFAILVVNNRRNLGKARYLLKKAVTKVRKEF